METKLWFWVFGLLLGLFMGPAQAASRSMMRIAPAEYRTEMFGLFAFGAGDGDVGPFVLGTLTYVFVLRASVCQPLLAFWAPV